MFDSNGIEQARRVVARVMPPTPQYRWPGLRRHAGCEVWVKHENHTPTGAFKVRGGLVLLDELERAGTLPEKIITATRGNHGQSIPFAAVPHGVSVTVLAPKGNSAEKNAAMVGWGAELVEFGSDYEEARQEAARRAASKPKARCSCRRFIRPWRAAWRPMRRNCSRRSPIWTRSTCRSEWVPAFADSYMRGTCCG